MSQSSFYWMYAAAKRGPHPIWQEHSSSHSGHWFRGEVNPHLQILYKCATGMLGDFICIPCQLPWPLIHLQCFRDRILECGNEQQKETFSELGRALMFICAPFSLNRQRVLLQQHSCISKVLSLPISAGCKLPKQPYGDKLDSCKWVKSVRVVQINTQFIEDTVQQCRRTLHVHWRHGSQSRISAPSTTSLNNVRGRL